MKRNTMLKILNPILGVLMAIQVATGIVYGCGKIPYETFQIVHGKGGMALAVVAILHVVLNWNWVKANFFKGFSAGPGQGAAPKQG